MTNIIASTAADPRFTVLSRALTAAGMVDTLGGSGPFTLFAPTDDAFGQLSPAQFEQLMTREARATLTSLMTFHAVAGKPPEVDLGDGQSMPTIHGQPVHLRSIDGQLRIDGIKVIEILEASNGVIYVINAVLVPPAVKAYFLLA